MRDMTKTTSSMLNLTQKSLFTVGVVKN